MKTRSLPMTVIGTVLLVGACEAKHAHDAPPPESSQRPSLSITEYQSGLELFMEYPAFVMGEQSALVAHFTDARDPEGFKWITEGVVTATLEFPDGSRESFVADKPLRSGIFKPVVVPKKSGTATLTLVLAGPHMQGAVAVGDVVVHADTAAAVKASEAAGNATDPTVAFLKEAQWQTQYATALAAPRVLMGGVQATGELMPVAGQAAELAAPVAGRVHVGDSVPFIGQIVKKGALLLSIVPTSIASGADRASLELETSRANTELGLAERELTRSEELFAARAIPEKQLDAARGAVAVAQARVTASGRQLALAQSAQRGSTTSGAGGAAFELRAPIDGVVFHAHVTRGAVVEAGERLVAVVNTERLWLEARVYESDVAKVEASPGAMFSVAGFDRPFSIDEKNGRRVAVGAVVDSATRTVPVIFELDNSSSSSTRGALKPGMYAKVTLLTGATIQGVAVPDQAIVDDNGEPTVFVMEGGESFFKRRVKLGARSGGYTQVLEGVKDGERVVSRGAYDLKLAAMAGTVPGHGHAH